MCCMKNFAIWGVMLLVILVGVFILFGRGSSTGSSSNISPQAQNEGGQIPVPSQNANTNPKTKTLQPPALPE